MSRHLEFFQIAFSPFSHHVLNYRAFQVGVILGATLPCCHLEKNDCEYFTNTRLENVTSSGSKHVKKTSPINIFRHLGFLKIIAKQQKANKCNKGGGRITASTFSKGWKISISTHENFLGNFSGSKICV